MPPMFRFRYRPAVAHDVSGRSVFYLSRSGGRDAGNGCVRTMSGGFRYHRTRRSFSGSSVTAREVACSRSGARAHTRNGSDAQ